MASWELYEAGTTSPITSFGLTGGSAADACLKALALWRPSVISGQIAGGESPVIGLPDARQSTTERQPSGDTSVQPTSLSLNEVGWVPLSELNNKKGDPSPTEIMFPDGSHALLKHQYKMLTKVVRWLIENGHLSEKQCPIPLGPQSKNFWWMSNLLIPMERLSAIPKKKVRYTLIHMAIFRIKSRGSNALSNMSVRTSPNSKSDFPDNNGRPQGLQRGAGLTRSLIGPTTVGDHKGSPLQFITLTYGVLSCSSFHPAYPDSDNFHGSFIRNTS